MGSTTFSITPAAGAQANDAEDMINGDNQQTSITFPVDILVTDVVAVGATTGVLVSSKQFAFQVMGIKATSNFFTPLISSNEPSRITWRDMNLVIPQGNSFAISQGEQGAAAEFWRIFIKYEPVR
jgi:hypothetical protein|tara:strand:+ start:1742 stop:2116 length:375 start_codon:yes stop_codon:yes gene_type:complete